MGISAAQEWTKMEFGDQSDNPFSVDFSQKGRGKAKGVKSALKLLALVAVGLTVTLAVTRFTPRWLVQRYTNGFESLPSQEKRERLVQLASLGDVAIDPLVSALADPDPEVARTAYDLLSENQNAWTILPARKLQRNHATLVRSIQAIAVYLPDDRTGWASSLLQETIQYSVNRQDKPSKLLYDDANHAMDMLAISDRAGPSILSNEPLDSSAPQRLYVRSEPLPVKEIQAGLWTDWPPPEARDRRSENDSQGIQPVEASMQAGEMEVADKPSVYRSSLSRLTPVEPNQAVVLHDVNAQLAPADGDLSSNVQAAAHLIDSPLGTFDDRSVMHWLGSENRELRGKARDELTARGYNENEITIATQIVSADLATRLALIDAIAHLPQIDPRPWLLMLLDDESRDVKLQAISVLATMNDPAVNSQLRLRVTEERDPTVAARIRRVLNLR
ncbi:MAG: HEAT repeat domain-containing protein [Rubripirellula sp.]|nr:HEAT repeat domain-containing protein [Rubripirellula sp.]